MVTAILSYISRDCISTPLSKTYKIGGKAYYTGLALASLGEETHIFIHVDPKSDDMLEHLNHSNLHTHYFLSNKTPEFENIFTDQNLNNRIFKASLDDFKFTRHMINQYDDVFNECDVIHLAPSQPSEIPLSVISLLKHKYKAKISMDLDFFIKDCQGKFTVYNSIEDILPYANFAIVSQEDYSFVGIHNTELVITKGSEGAVIFNKQDNRIIINPYPAEKITDTTGAGDTFMAAYLFYRRDHSIQESGDFAAKIASIKISSNSALTPESLVSLI